MLKKIIQLSLKPLIIFVLSPLAALGAGLECKSIPNIMELFLQGHLVHRSLTNELKNRTVEQFIKSMDPSKTLLLESDIAKIQSDLMKEFEASKTGDCSSLSSTNALLVSRATENLNFVKEILTPEFKLDEEIELILDSKKRHFPKTAEEKKEVLRKMVHFQISNILLSKVKLPEAKKQLIHRYELSIKRIKEEKLSQQIASFADAFASSLDPHSSFLSPDSFEDFQISMQLSLEGIGASLRSTDGFTVIEELIKGGSADRSKLLKPKDKIIAVAQETGSPVSTIDMDLRDVVKLIRGKKGTKVILTILRQGEKTTTFQATLTRDKIDLVDQAAKLTYETRKLDGKSYKIGIIDLPSFYGRSGKGGRTCSTDVKNLLLQAVKEKVDGVVLNVSRNGGGLLDEAVKISGLFISRGAVVATKNTRNRVEILQDEESSVVYQGPLVVLTSRLSASASEILAGALQDYHRAVIVGGDHTFGKGSVQVLADMPEGQGAMKVTTGMFYVPGGLSTQGGGVPSDVALPSVFNTDEIGEAVLDYALPPQKIDVFLSQEANTQDPWGKWEPVKESDIKALSKKSKERITTDPKFAEVEKRIAKAKKNKGIVKLSEIAKEEKSKKKDKKSPKDGESASDETDEADEKIPFIQEATSVAVDLVRLQKP